MRQDLCITHLALVECVIVIIVIVSSNLLSL